MAALSAGLSACSSDEGGGPTDGSVGGDAVVGDGGTDGAPQGVCGDLSRDPGEACDDGNTTGGDGCAADCSRVEDGWSCPATGACSQVIECGDGSLASSEACDDGNTLANDGCAADCSAIEDGWACHTPGEPCEAKVCGDGIVAGAEACDDGNITSFDGCADDCTVESGWVCTTSGCIAAECGDGIVAGQEVCDDGNAVDGDGCASNCRSIEPEYACPPAGGACTSTVRCGDQIIGSGEACDDGNTVGGDGCSANCSAVENGWACPIVGTACEAAECGDGIVAGLEECDDGNGMNGDGCSSVCVMEEGYKCPPAGGSCSPTTCGDGVVEGTEQCDDGNTRPFDGCDAQCHNEPMCSGGTCTPICGDGVILPGAGQEACDDGNVRDGDGCSSTCTIELGWNCVNQPQALPDTLDLPLVLRDFKGIQWYADDTTEHGHPDFNDPNDGNDTISFGLVENMLGSNGRPVLSYTDADPADDTGRPKHSDRFAEWYDSSSPWNIEVVRTLTLTKSGNTYGYDSTAEGFPGNSTSGFYPIDDGGWVAEGSEALRTSDGGVNDGNKHNFNFTTETHFWFQYDGTEVLDFSGDDDLWVFIDGVLCLDVGGLHPETGATMNLANPSAESNTTQRSIVQACKDHLDGLVTTQNPEPLVEMAIFHAERHTKASNFRLQLTGFVKQTTVCTAECGNGIVTPGEVCDDGTNDGSYGGCAPGCQARGGYCGDGMVNGPKEQCDLGAAMNDGTYDGCNPDCTNGPTCGDGVVQPANEVCDDGTNTGGYGGCSGDCQTRGAYCGDGTINGPEECDDGLGNNDGSYGGCNPDCTTGPACGDGIKQPSEQCDDGNLTNGDGCNALCRFEVG